MQANKDQLKKGVQQKTIFLVSGIIVLIIGLCFIFPYESRKTFIISELIYTYLSLTIALFLLMFGLIGQAFFKGLLLIIGSAILGFIGFLLPFKDIPLGSFGAFWLGVPSGIVAGLVFLIINSSFLKAKTSYKLIKQLGIYISLLLLASILFIYGGDWIFEISMYLKTI